jgi:hypothetical protein
LEVEAPGGQDAGAQEYQAYSELPQRSPAGWIDIQNVNLFLSEPLVHFSSLLTQDTLPLQLPLQGPLFPSEVSKEASALICLFPVNGLFRKYMSQFQNVLSQIFKEEGPGTNFHQQRHGECTKIHS